MDDFRGDRAARQSDGYVSCMKINGIPLLPPLMTPEYRKEMQYYKQLAAAAERRLSDLKLEADETTMNSNILPSDSEDWNDSVNLSILSPQSVNKLNRFVCDERDKNSFEYLETNEFESMNSQVTVIDNETEKSSKADNLIFSEPDLIKWNTSSEKINSPPSPIKSTPVLPLVVGEVHESLIDRADTATAVAKGVRSTAKQKSQGAIHIPTDKKIPKEKLKESKKLNVKEVLKTNSRTKCSPKPALGSIKNKRKSNNEKENFPLSKVSPPSNKMSFNIEKNDQKLIRKITNKKIEKVSLSPSKNITGSLDNISTGLSTPPKLVRQNSYTLKHPSPLLLAHLEERSLASGVDLRSISMSESTSLSFLCTTPKQKSWESNTAKGTWSSTGSDLNSISINDTQEANSFNKEPKNTTELILPNLEVTPLGKDDSSRLSSAKILDFEINDEPSVTDAASTKSSIVSNKLNKISIQSENDLFTTSSNDLQTQQDITSIPFDEESKTRNHSSAKLPHLHDFCTNVKSDECLNEILKKVKDDHEKKLAELIKKQEEEQLRLKKEFEDQQKVLLSQFKTTILETAGNSNTESQNDMPNILSINCQNEINESANGSDEFENFLKMSTDMLNKSRQALSNCTNLSSKPRNQFEDINKKTNDEESANISDSFDKFHLGDLTYRTNNTLDDINSTFTSEDFESGNEAQIDYLSLMPEITNKEWESMSKLKSAYDKINRIQQNLASQSIYRNLPRYTCKNESRPNELAENGKDNISLSSLNDSHSNDRPTVLDRKCLSLNLIDVHKPDYGHDRKKRYGEKETRAANIIVAYAKGYLARRLMKTEKVQSTVQTIKDTLMCAIQLHRDEGGIRGADVDLHRRLIQQITAACYSLHDIFIASTPKERVAIIAQDRERRTTLSHRSGSSCTSSGRLSAATQRALRRKIERMSRSHTGVFERPSRGNMGPDSMTRSHYESKSLSSDRHRRSVAVAVKPWR